MNAISSVLSVSACFLSILAILSAVLTAIRLRELRDRLAPLSASRVKLLETSMAEQRDALEAVANRVKMMRVRSAANHVPDKPEPAAADPAAVDAETWRRTMNRRIAESRIAGKPLT